MIPHNLICSKCSLKAEEMVQLLKSTGCSPEHPHDGFYPTITPDSRGSDAIFWLQQILQTHGADTH